MASFVEIDIDVKAIDEIRRGLKQYRHALSRELRKALVDTLLDIERVAKERCPVRTGRLRASLHPEIVAFLEGLVGTNVEYAPHVEYGTKKMAAQPYMEPAYRHGERVAQKHFDAAIARLQKLVHG